MERLLERVKREKAEAAEAALQIAGEKAQLAKALVPEERRADYE